jgi:DNA-binding transcriptional LysR family regulator
MQPANLDEMAVFIDVVRAGSISSAARAAGVPKSTISRAVKRLEARTGSKLLRAAGRGPLLTDAGEAFATGIAAHVRALRDAAARDLSAPDEPYGRLRITCLSEVGEFIVGPAVARLVSRYPRLTIEASISERVLDLVGEGFDAAVRLSARGPLASSSLVSKKLGELKIGIFAAPSYVQRRRWSVPRDLEAEPWVGFGGDSRFTWSGPEGSFALPTRSRITANDAAFVRASLRAGAGIGLLPTYFARADVAEGRLVHVLPRYSSPSAGLYLVYPPQRPLPAKLSVLRDALVQSAAEALA